MKRKLLLLTASAGMVLGGVTNAAAYIPPDWKDGDPYYNNRGDIIAYYCHDRCTGGSDYCCR